MRPVASCAFLFGIAILFFSDSASARRGRVRASRVVKELIEEVVVSPPKDREVCFSPVSRCDLKLIKFIESAKKSIDVAVFDINLDQLVHELIEKSRQIPVRVLVDSRQSKEKSSLVSTLVKGGVEVRLGTQRGLMHDKFSIVDDKRIETGSFNYTNHATRANQENQIYLGDPEIVDQYRSRFNESWGEGRRIRD
jgi:phosphatidylserine/phosphatidylglycerophosphate/cardiolipin synthase-like enzyme